MILFIFTHFFKQCCLEIVFKINHNSATVPNVKRELTSRLGYFQLFQTEYPLFSFEKAHPQKGSNEWKTRFEKAPGYL